MALKPTIYKFAITLADIDRGRYEDLALTVALHPSETLERMLVRVLARCLEDEDDLTFTGGLSETDTPDLWRKHLDGRIATWIEVGEPSADRLRKASRVADRVIVYTFNTRSDVWWPDVRRDLSEGSVAVYRLRWPEVQALTPLAQRTAAFTITIARPTVLIVGDRTGAGALEFNLEIETLDAGAPQE